MKKLATILCLTAVATAAFAQGTVNPGNTLATAFRTNGLAAGLTTGNTATTLGGFYYAVLTAPSSVTTVDTSLQGLLSAPWSDTGLMGTNTAIATGGRMSGPAGAGGIVANWPSTSQSFIVVGWSANEGTTWAAVAAKLLGASLQGGQWINGGLVGGGYLGATTIQAAVSGQPTGVGAFSLFGSLSSAAGTPVTTPTDLFYVNVPEPTTMALAGLGAAAMVIFRRRK